MTKEDKAKIARENGAKSKGPTTQAGKDRSRANGLVHGRRAQTLRHLAEPHPAVLCSENGRAYFKLFNDLIAFYRPIGPVALDIVREIASARWEMTRLQLIKTSSWNRQFIREKHKDHNLPEELVPIECAINVSNNLVRSDATYNSAIDRLLGRIARLERRLRYVSLNFPSLGAQIASCEDEAKHYDRTGGEPTQPVEDTQPVEKNELPLVTDDGSESVRQAYQYFFPGRELIVVERTETAGENEDEHSTKPN
ncbi:MAG: hypothetical protein HYX27_10395 [Acidobacteria bacterium]|nr:hypothetical protein [Acidobacteriota bacterium]